MPSQDIRKFTPVSYRISALWGRCPALTPPLQLITPSRESGTADHVQSLDDLLLFALILYVHMLQEKMALVARQTELLEQIDNYETGRQESDKLINELKSEVDKNNAGM